MHPEHSHTYTIEPGDTVRDHDTILALWQGNFGPDEEHTAKLRHYYEQCPFGTPLLCLLRHQPSGQPVGVIGAIPRRMIMGGREIRGAVISHFVVLPAHRSLGPALQLQAAIIEACHGRFDFIYGIPNQKATAILKRAGHRELCQLERHVKVLRYGQYLPRIMPALPARLLAPVVDAAVRVRHALRAAFRFGLHARWSEQADPRMDEAWAATAPADDLLAVRDSTHARWRFNTVPSERMRFLLVSRGDSLRAWFVCEDSTGAPGTLAVLDYWFAGADLRERRSAIRVLLDRAVADGHTAVELLITGNRVAADGWAAERFIHRGGQSIMGKWLDESQRAPDPARIHMTYSDQDS